mmetsp:Transcript_968/g.2909  ORF Transcript_968/g.2909 Transcript_968/m.2909 type:complete len:245 (+) Transcript_968:106-840(+)
MRMVARLQCPADRTRAPPGPVESRRGQICTRVAVGAGKQPSGYYKLDRLLWSGSEEEALARGAPVEQLKPPWKVMLLSEGSVTRHLELLFGKPGVQVDCFEMKDVGPFSMDKTPCTCEIPGLDMAEEGYQTVRRQVYLMQDGAEPLVYAVSFWRKDAVDEYLKDKQLPIWSSLRAERRELYREIVDVQLGYSAPLEAAFGCQGPLWGRTYVFWHDSKPLTIIYEVFSNKLDRFLGPSSDDERED